MKPPRRTRDDWLSFYRELAVSRGGRCLSTEYVSGKEKLRWICGAGHAWESLPGNAKAGHWCMICGNLGQGRKKAKSIEWARQLAEDKGGKCLSSEYINNSTKLTWLCENKHEWSAAAGSIQQGRWCPVCAGKMPPDMALNDLRQVAHLRGGQCLSDRYSGAKNKLRWRCRAGHEWSAAPDSVRRGTWCPHCAGNLQLTLKDMREAARAKGGECLSTSYSNSDESLLWRCAAGHEWRAVAYHVRAGHWCPICSAGNSERICRDIFEQMFGLPFPKSRPAWLLGTKGRKMELDGYCERLNLAFEYHGHQHYQPIKFFNQGEKNLEKQRRDDGRKERLCLDHGVHLIAIPYTVPMTDVPELVYRAAENYGLNCTLKPPAAIRVAEFVLPELIAIMHLLAKERGGECLSTFYVNNSTCIFQPIVDGVSG